MRTKRQQARLQGTGPRRLRCHVASRRQQIGAELVETLLTMTLFFFLVFTIIDLSIGVYDQGVVVNASRVGARQGSLFWLDPTNFDRNNLPNNVRIKEGMIGSAVDYYASLLMRPDAAVATTEYTVNNGVVLNADDVVCCSGCNVNTCVSDAEVSVDVGYTYSGFTAVPWIPDLTLRGLVGLPAEARL
jgi:hypothetical protein